MRINTKVRYGLRAILQIAAGYGGDPIPVSSIAKAQGISGKYLEQVVGSLRRAGLIVSRKGVRGGYILARSPEKITLRDIIQTLDPKPELMDCIAQPESCERADKCLTRDVWSLLNDRLDEFWRGFTLRALLNRVGPCGVEDGPCLLETGEEEAAQS